MNKTPLPHSSDKVTCGICGNKFNERDMTGKTVGIWFVVCCEKCRREEQEIGKVVWEPKIKRK